ncbi:MAG: hypothetical protein RMJ34_04605 [candidate division WOR-3 bacterium]|nr:hypothetical protein [candidate division WOR-3 bacterium]MDW8114196.1 hypothetical protein [candidate division WOR-3 bacterium]
MKRFFIFLLLFSACLYIDNVNQPSSVSLGEYFTIIIQGTFDNSIVTARGWLAMMLPAGIRIDSIRYNTSNGYTELLTQISDTVTRIATNAFPPDPNMVWHGYETRDYSGIGSGTYEARVYLYVINTAFPGDYLIDYRTGSSYHNHLLLDSILNQPLRIATSGIKEKKIKLKKFIKFDILGRRIIKK